jgi:hypothetical protein
MPEAEQHLDIKVLTPVLSGEGLHCILLSL